MKKIFAFPFIENTRDNYGNVHLIQHNGMELRDYFAASAMQGIIASGDIHKSLDDDRRDRLAFLSYQVAESMLKIRSAKNGND